MLLWQCTWLIIQIEYRSIRGLYLILGVLYGVGLLVAEWWHPGITRLDMWRPWTSLHTVWKG